MNSKLLRRENVVASYDARAGEVLEVDGTQSRHAVTGTTCRGQIMAWTHAVLWVRVMEETLPRLTSDNGTGESRDAMIDGRMRDRPRPKLVRRDPDGAYVSNAMLELITGLNLDVQVTPPEAPWHLSVLGTVHQLVKRSASLHAMDEGRTNTCAERLHIRSTAHNRLLKRGGFTPVPVVARTRT